MRSGTGLALEAVLLLETAACAELATAKNHAICQCRGQKDKGELVTQKSRQRKRKSGDAAPRVVVAAAAAAAAAARPT